MPLHYLIICEVCETKTEYEKTEDMPYEAHGFNHFYLCPKCSDIAQKARDNIDSNLIAEMKRLRKLA